ncbi:hypothetical protein J4460_04760 [Candidatus Woesearchaeota archaeon]|nr:MAG: hypothetical protein QS99_C0017G0027 [archaeon GW2011_AR4]MBS3129959.1 hypothetical protein [Candidatus Woesearchaeota archaeon]HIH38682.1 hypothetical protein [Candidatus Woesearchaeota archaeon]HIJ03395.1 hypothetical protein [Candidatus Woesearchaeota archaeon]
MKEKEDVNELKDKYINKLDSELIGLPVTRTSESIESLEYEEFKESYMPKHMILYERACAFSEKILKIKPSPAKEKEIIDSIQIAHLNITPTGAMSFAVLFPLLLVLVGGALGIVLFGTPYFFGFMLIMGMIMYVPLTQIPKTMANTWRMKGSNQMVLCIFYVVTYMRHTSNLELAIKFAGDHLNPPLSLDLKRVLWNIETEKYSTVTESLDAYLGTWEDFNREFIEAFHLIEASIYEASEERRVNSLEKSLEVILSETYERMLHYAHDLKSPITMLHMLGIILPILGLVILPLVVSFMEGVKWYHILSLYNILLPIFVYYIGKNILSTRPTGYGDTDISDLPDVKKYKNILIHVGKNEIQLSPLYISILIFIFFFLIGFLPIAVKMVPGIDIVNHDITLPLGMQMFEYRMDNKTHEVVGPYGIGATILSLGIPLAFGLALGYYFKLRSKNIIKIREEAKKLEAEFASALFQFGNRIGDGIPAEIAFDRVGRSMQGTVSGSFFLYVSQNIQRLGMSVEDAIFDKKVGAINHFPSALIESSMKVLVESSRKGPQVASNALMNVSTYIKEIHKVDERLQDLMADIISSMKAQIKFMSPVISGIVIGITSMVTTIIGKLSIQLTKFQEQGSSDMGGGMANIPFLFGNGVPTYYFQIVVGLYVVQLIFILTILTNGIENGADKLNERFELGRNLIGGTILYCIVTLIITLIFNIIASQILSSFV